MTSLTRMVSLALTLTPTLLAHVDVVDEDGQVAAPGRARGPSHLARARVRVRVTVRVRARVRVTDECEVVEARDGERDVGLLTLGPGAPVRVPG